MPYQTTSGPLYWIRAGQKGCASSLFQSYMYEVCGSLWVGFSVNHHPVGGLSLLHSHVRGPNLSSVHPLVVTDIYLLCGLTAGPHQDSLFTVVYSGLSLLLKNTDGNP